MSPKPPKSPRLMPANDQALGNMFDYLPDEVVVHLCRYMDSYSLLKFGRSSARLYNLVCTPLVWKRLLRGIADFTVAKVRMLMFFANKGDSLYKMTEVLREIASRNLLGHDIVRVRVTIEGWSASKTYDLCAGALERMLMVEKESGARMILKEVKEFEGSRQQDQTGQNSMPVVRYFIGEHVTMQQEMVGYIESVHWSGHRENQLHILMKSRKWLIHEFDMVPSDQLTMDHVNQHWRYLASSAAGGQIKMLILSQIAMQPIFEEILESVRKVWEISDNVKVKLEDKSQVVRVGGRSAENREESWQEFKAVMQLS